MEGIKKYTIYLRIYVANVGKITDMNIHQDSRFLLPSAW
jgi:hypothetical protein